jgi:hypothetical protein
MYMLSVVFVFAVIAVAIAAFFVMNPETKHEKGWMVMRSSRGKKGVASGGAALAVVLVGIFIILFAAPLLFLVTHLS